MTNPDPEVFLKEFLTADAWDSWQELRSHTAGLSLFAEELVQSFEKQISAAYRAGLEDGKEK